MRPSSLLLENSSEVSEQRIFFVGNKVFLVRKSILHEVVPLPISSVVLETPAANCKKRRQNI